MEISGIQRSNIIYAIMHVLLKEVDQEQGADDLIHALHVGDTDIAELKPQYKCLAENPYDNSSDPKYHGASDFVELLTNEISGEFENEEGELFNVVLTQLQILYDMMVQSGNQDEHVFFAGKLLAENEGAIIQENLPCK